MESINELNEAIDKVIQIANRLIGETNAEIFNKAPVIVHQRFCAELVRVMKENPNKAPMDVPEAVSILSSINVLEKCYPEIKS